LFAAQAMLYFASVSFAEVSQRVAPSESVAWNGFLGVGDPVLEPLAHQALARLTRIGGHGERSPSPQERADFSQWMSRSIAARNVAGLADPRRRNLYPVDFDALIEAHDLLGLSRDEVIAALPALRGMSAPMAPGVGANLGLAAMASASPLYASDEANNPR
jgi:hypothetical protein